MVRVRRQIFERIDKDGTGQLTLEDLVAGWETMGN
jgi:Ca2+-binding EF-hand superfamily protein